MSLGIFLIPLFFLVPAAEAANIVRLLPPPVRCSVELVKVIPARYASNRVAGSAEEPSTLLYTVAGISVPGWASSLLNVDLIGGKAYLGRTADLDAIISAVNPDSDLLKLIPRASGLTGEAEKIWKQAQEDTKPAIEKGRLYFVAADADVQIYGNSAALHLSAQGDKHWFLNSELWDKPGPAILAFLQSVQALGFSMLSEIPVSDRTHYVIFRPTAPRNPVGSPTLQKLFTPFVNYLHETVHAGDALFFERWIEANLYLIQEGIEPNGDALFAKRARRVGTGFMLDDHFFHVVTEARAYFISGAAIELERRLRGLSAVNPGQLINQMALNIVTDAINSGALKALEDFSLPTSGEEAVELTRQGKLADRVFAAQGPLRIRAEMQATIDRVEKLKAN